MLLLSLSVKTGFAEAKRRFQLEDSCKTWFVYTVKKLTRPACLFAVLFLIANSFSLSAAVSDIVLGDAPEPPTSLAGLPGGGLKPRIATGGFSVDTSSRQQVREFYNSVFTASTGVPINTTAVVGSCFPGTNSPTFNEATLRRINWYRAMAGIPASITLNAAENAKCQAAAVLMAEHGALQHAGIWTGWNCVSADGTNAAGSSNLALGSYGPDAITGYIWDFGGNNAAVGHRRWILYPQTQVMGTGDVPLQSPYNSANSTWIFDANYGGPRPTTRTPYVAWPPAGYVPYQVVFPQWSFALSNCDFSTSTVTMASNGVPIAITLQPYSIGSGENTRVWYPTGLDTTTSTAFPFSGTDTVYSITISNVITPFGTKNFAYTVTVFNPATAGADYSPLVINGPAQPVVATGNAYTCTPSTNPAVSGYQWIITQATNGFLVDNASNGLINFSISPTPTYPIITNAFVGGAKCFHLAHPTGTPQLLQLNEVLYPSNSTLLNFKSMLRWGVTNVQIARVQVSTDGGNIWQDIYTQSGTGGSGDASFAQKSLSLSSYVGKSTMVRFNYDFMGGSRFPQTDPDVGWSIQNIVVTNSLQLVNGVTNVTASTNLVFTPTQTGDYLLQARSVIFTDFPTELGTPKQVTAIAGSTQITINSIAVTNTQVKINFSLSGTAPSFKLLQKDTLTAAWTTNGAAVLTTNVPGVSFQFTTATGPVMRFYRVQTP